MTPRSEIALSETAHKGAGSKAIRRIVGNKKAGDVAGCLNRDFGARSEAKFSGPICSKPRGAGG